MAYIQLARLFVILLAVTVSVSVVSATVCEPLPCEGAAAFPLRAALEAQPQEEKKARTGAQRRRQAPVRAPRPILWLLQRAKIAAERLAAYAAPTPPTLQTLFIRMNN